MKTLLFLTTVILTVFSLTTKAQSPTIKLDWAKSAGGATGIDNATSVAYDASGNVYTAGYFRGTVDFDPSASTFTLASNGLADAFIQKLDANGNFISAYKIGAAGDDAINAIHVDATGNIFIAGYYRNSIDIDLGAGISALNSGTIQSCFIVKYTPTFSLTWAKSLTGASAQYVNSLNVDSNGNVYTGGTVGVGTIDFDPNAGTSNYTVSTSAFFLHKLSSTGTLVWAKGFNATAMGNAVNSIDFDSNQNPVFVGSFNGTVDFDASATTNTLAATSINMFVCKYDAAGNYQFAFQMGFTGPLTGFTYFNEDIVRKVVIDNSNNIYIAGEFTGITDFDPSATASATLSTIGGQSSQSTDGFIAKYNSSGGFLWVDGNIGNTGSWDKAIGLSVNSSGDVFVANNYNNGTNYSVKIYKHNSAGTQLYSRVLATSAYCNDIQSTTTTLLVAGHHETTSDFDPTQYFTYNLTSNGATDAFVAKYSECTTQAPSTITGPTALCNGSINTYSVAPNAQLEGYVWSSNILSGFSTSTTNIVSLTSGQTASTGTIALTGYNHCGNTTQTLQVTVTPNTTVNVASSSSSVCAGNSVTLTASGNATSYSWSSGETTGSIIKIPNAPTTYSVTGYNGNCSSTKTLSIAYYATPTIGILKNQPSLCAGSTVQLSITGNPVTYTWSTGQSNTAINVTPTVNTTYSVTGTSGVGCVKTETINVTLATPVLTVSSSAYTVCPGGTATLTALGATSYTWNGPGGITSGSTRIVTPTVTATYLLGGSTSGCFAQQISITITVQNSITVSATTSSTISCSNSPVQLTANGASSYTWMPGALSGTSVTVTPSSNTIYTVTGANGTCSGTKTISIAAGTTPNMNAVTNNTLLCAGQNANLNVSVTPMIPGMTYTWSTGQILPGIAVSPSVTTTYTVIGKNMQGCTNTASITQSVSPQIAVSVTTNSTVSCSGSPVILSASGATTYTWNTGSNSNTVSVSPTSNTTYSVTGASGACSNSQTISVNASTNPSLSAVTNNTLLCVSQSALLTANGVGVVSYLWNTGAVSANISVTPTTTTVYSVTGTNAFGCSTTIAITQSVSTCTGLNEAESTTTLFSVYPNPNNGEFTITTTKGVYNIINSIGAIVKTIEVENDTEVIDVKYLSQGIYYIVGKTAKAKIIITK